MCFLSVIKYSTLTGNKTHLNVSKGKPSIHVFLTSRLSLHKVYLFCVLCHMSFDPIRYFKIYLKVGHSMKVFQFSLLFRGYMITCRTKCFDHLCG